MYCVDLGESFQTHIYFQNVASIQPRSSPVNEPADIQAGTNEPSRDLVSIRASLEVVQLRHEELGASALVLRAALRLPG